MYSEWVSQTESIQSGDTPANVLQVFPSSVGRDVVHSILLPLTAGSSLLPSSAGGGEGEGRSVSVLATPEQVQWTMQVIDYGLSLSLSEHALIGACVQVYEVWLTALHTPRSAVPAPVLERPDHYAQVVFGHFCQLFVPRGPADRNEAGFEMHLSLCRKVLQITHSVVMTPSARLSRDTWNALFRYLLRIADSLLSPPLEPQSLGAYLCDLIVHILFEAWLRASATCFPDPSLWKSLRELCSEWRHHPSLVEQWNKLMYSLTIATIDHLYSPRHLAPLGLSERDEDPDIRGLVRALSDDALVQCWFRLLHTLGNPVELAHPLKIASSPSFRKAAISLPEVNRAPSHPCLGELPDIFYEAMRGVAVLVCLFLAQELPQDDCRPGHASRSSSSSTPAATGRPSPALHRKGSKEGKGVGPKARSTSTAAWYVNMPPATEARPQSATPTLGSELLGTEPRGNTLLHLFGSWLFEAAVWPFHSESMEAKRSSRSSSILTSYVDLGRAQEGPLHPQSDPVSARRFEAGRAEALASLCSVLCSRPCGEPFLPIYLARFYHALAVGLHFNEEFCRGEMLTKIVLHSSPLFCKDLPGVHVLLPSFLAALELILPKPDVRLFSCEVNLQDLRHSSILLLLSMLALPLHFLHLPLPDLTSLNAHMRPTLSSLSVAQEAAPDPEPSPFIPSSTSVTLGATFYSLKDQIIQLLFGAIQHERDATNMQMLLHGLMVIVQDIVTYENAVLQMLEEAASAAEDGDPPQSLDEQGLPTAGNEASHYSLRHALSLSSTAEKVAAGFPPPMLFRLAVEAAHRALGEWEGSVQVSLAALQLMMGLSQLTIENIDHNDCKQAARWVCEYIEHQALKSHPLHNRDLHTSIVAAFQTLLTWLLAHPYILGDKTCLTAVMNVIELGISGTSSMKTNGDVTYKGGKESRPISGRVKDIAEFVMACVMDKVGSFPSPCGAETSSSLLCEEELLSKLPPERRNDTHFRYFVVDNSLILALLEEPFSEEEASSPRLTAVLRSPVGRHVWTMKLRHHPRSEKPSTSHLHSMPRPAPSPRPPTPPSMERPPWPMDVETEPHLKVDDSIPSLEEVLNESTRELHSKLTELTIRQMRAEESVHQDVGVALSSRPYPDPGIALEPPEVKKRFETARLFLSHLGLLGIGSVWHHHPQAQSLAMLDSSSAVFRSVLSSLDQLPTRSCNTVFVLYCKEGLTKPEEVLCSQLPLSNKPPEFTEFLHSLGWVVDPLHHPGFLGKIRPKKSDDVSKAVGIAAQIPVCPFPYYADAMTEVAFVTPTLRPSSSDSSTSLRSGESSDSASDITASLPTLPTVGPVPPGQADPLTSLPSHIALKEPQGSGVSESNVQAEYSTYPGRGKHASTTATKMNGSNADTPRRRTPLPQDCAVLVIWLENFEDHLSFPLEALSAALHGPSLGGFAGSHKPLQRSLPTVFIHQLSSGLYQIVTKTSSSRQDLMAGPLINGMVVSRRTLGPLVRQTTVSMCSRHRMEHEGYSPPQVKRKRKIEEISTAHVRHLHIPEFYTKLFVE